MHNIHSINHAFLPMTAYDSLYNYFILFNARWFYSADTCVYTQELKVNKFVPVDYHIQSEFLNL